MQWDRLIITKNRLDTNSKDLIHLITKSQNNNYAAKIDRIEVLIKQEAKKCINVTSLKLNHLMAQHEVYQVRLRKISLTKFCLSETMNYQVSIIRSKRSEEAIQDRKSTYSMAFKTRIRSNQADSITNQVNFGYHLPLGKVNSQT